MYFFANVGLAIDEREKKIGDKRIKSSKGEEVLNAAAKEGIVSFEDGGGAEESAAGIAQNGKAIKWRKHTTKVLLKVRVSLGVITLVSGCL